VNTFAAPSTGGIRQVVRIDASPIGQNTRSTPAAYSWAFDQIRRLFAESAYARRRRWKAGPFSFNTRRGHHHRHRSWPGPARRRRPPHRRGPGGGPDGGHILAAGAPEDVARDPGSVTGLWLAEYLVSGIP
jgi:excinuclease UvrABC ATPase subunit